MSRLNSFLSFPFDLRQLILNEPVISQQQPAEFCQGIIFPYVIQLIIIPVQFMPVRIGMGMYPHAVCLDDDGVLMLLYIFFSLMHGIHGIEDILTVAVHDFQVFETGKVIGYLSSCGLILLRYRNTVTVILKYKNYR